MLAIAIASLTTATEADQTLSHDSEATLQDLEIVRKRILDTMHVRITVEAVQPILDTLQADGSWHGIDYQDQSRSGWSTCRHLSNVLLLTRAYRSPRSELRGDPKLRAAVLKSLDYWLERDFQNPNWWWNVIGVPRTLLPTALLLESELSAVQLDGCLDILERAKIGMTGQNLVWVSHITAGRGILKKDPALVAKAYDRIAQEIRISTDEGIQPDFSFHQHGPCLYNHGYGASFVVDCSRIATEVASTSFALPPEKIEILSNLILDGNGWMTRGQATDFGAEGREITRGGQDARYLHAAVANMLALPTGREQEFQDLAGRLRRDPDVALEGNRHFWRSDLMVHHRSQYMSSARMVSRRIANTDQPCNSEGLKSHHIADGCNAIFRTGQEYDGIFPVWDWQMIPGTTVERAEQLSGSPRRMGETDFAGGVSDGMFGVAAFDLVRGALAARKSWFFFDNEFVCLGAGIKCDSDNPVITTMNQCNLTGDVVVSENGRVRSLQRGNHVLNAPTWIWHDRIAYVFLQPSDTGVRNLAQSGVWWEINQRYSKGEISRDVFTLWFDHGKSPTDQTYAYLVVPEIDVASLNQYVDNQPVRVLDNNRRIQAVWHDALGIGGFAFYEAGKIAVRQDLSIRVDLPCLVLVRESAQGYTVSVSDPTAQQAVVRVEIAGAGDESGETRDSMKMTFELPDGMVAGRSVTQSVRSSAFRRSP
jgi:chondroitin AC lyase